MLPSASLTAITAASFSVIASSRQQQLLVLAVLGIASLDTTAAHNWIWSPRSRAPRASTIQPVRMRKDVAPHVQVGPGQEFEIRHAQSACCQHCVPG